LPNKDRILDSLRPGWGEMERGRWEGQNFQLKEIQHLEEEVHLVGHFHKFITMHGFMNVKFTNKNLHIR
jgi:hypothetical protein